MKPLVSVIIPTYNQARFIAGAIESVRAQDYPPERIEIIVIDDGSTDGTGEVVKGLGEDIKYHHQKNAGKAAATSAALERASGEYILNLDPDDQFLPGKVGKVAGIFEGYPGVIHVGHPVIYWDPEKETRWKERIPEQMLGRVLQGGTRLKESLADNDFYGGGSSFAGRAESLKKIPFPGDIGFNVDAYMVFSLMNAGNSFYIREPLSLYRIHPGSYSRRSARERVVMDIRAERSIYNCMRDQGVSDELRALFAFRLSMAELRMRESDKKKRFADIVSTWKEMMKTAGLANIDPIRLMKGYGLLKRSLPQKAVNAVRSLRSERGKGC